MIFDREWRRNRRIKKVFVNYQKAIKVDRSEISKNADRLIKALESGNLKAIRFYCNYFDSKGIPLPNDLSEFNDWAKNVAR